MITLGRPVAGNLNGWTASHEEGFNEMASHKAQGVSAVPASGTPKHARFTVSAPGAHPVEFPTKAAAEQAAASVIGATVEEA